MTEKLLTGTLSLNTIILNPCYDNGKDGPSILQKVPKDAGSPICQDTHGSKTNEKEQNALSITWETGPTGNQRLT